MQILYAFRKVSRGLGTSKAPTYIEHRKFREDCTKFFVKCVLRELDFAHIEVADAANLEVFVDDLLVRIKMMLIDADG